jgi:hypothetical protein
VGRYTHLHPARLATDAHLVIQDVRSTCVVKRKAEDLGTEDRVWTFWGRIANVGRQTGGLEGSLPAGEITGTFWVLRIPPNIPTLRHEDEVWVDDERYRIVHLRPLTHGQIAILSNLQ